MVAARSASCRCIVARWALVKKKESLAFSVGLRKAGNISSRTSVVDTGMSESCFFIVQGLHGLSEEGTKVGPGVFFFRFGVPSADLQGGLWEKLHMLNAG